MVRKLALGTALTTAILPSWALALGLGDIHLRSHLNQPLAASIPVVSAQPDELSSLRVMLASPADFARAGVDWQSQLQELRFTVERDGPEPLIRLSTSEAFREPFLSFLIEVNWSRGRLLREYTVLVDPPVFTEERTVAAPRQAAAEPAAARSVGAAPQGLPAPAQTPTEYGPTNRHDTLWRIAEQVRPDRSVSVEQTMLALQRLNPDAFIGENVNRLKAGHVLKIPDLAEIERLSVAEARTEFRRQTRIWRAETAPTARAAAERAAEPRGRLRLLAPEGEGAGEQAAAGATEGGAEGASGDALAAADADAAMRQENQALRERIEAMQQQLEQLQAVARLKDDQLAALEQQLRSLNSAPAAEEAAATDGEEIRYSAIVEATPATDLPANPYAVEGFEPVDLSGLPADLPLQPFAELAPESAEEAAVPPAPVAGEAPAVAAPVAEPEVAGSLARVRTALAAAVEYGRGNPLHAAGAAAVLLLAVLALMLARQRRRAAAGFGESILQESRGDEAALLAAAAGTGVSESESEERSSASSYMSDFGVSGIDSNIESEIGEADPLTEADVFLAYGRFQPAEKMIKEAIDAEPERLDLKVKLLEIYAAAENREAFEREAQLFHSAVEDHGDEQWQTVAAMGRALCPENPLFQDDAAAQPAPGAAEPVAEAPIFTADDEADSAAARDDNSIDYDLGDLEELTRGLEAEPAAPESAGGLDFDIDLDLASADGTGSEAPAADLRDEVAVLGDSLGGAAGEQLEAEGVLAEEDVAEFDLSDLGVDLDEIVQHPAAQTEAHAAEEGEPLVASPEDEVSTKLDLARAYIDMGDPDGAKNILDEVLEEGSEGQKHEAEALLQQIS